MCLRSLLMEEVMLSKNYYSSDKMQLYSTQNLSNYKKDMTSEGLQRNEKSKNDISQSSDTQESLFSKLVNSNNKSKKSKYGKNVEEYCPEKNISKHKYINNALFDDAGYNPDDYVFKPSGYSTNTDPSTSPFYVPCHYSAVSENAEQESQTYVPSQPSYSSSRKNNKHNEERYDFEFADDEINALLDIADEGIAAEEDGGNKEESEEEDEDQDEKDKYEQETEEEDEEEVETKGKTGNEDSQSSDGDILQSISNYIEQTREDKVEEEMRTLSEEIEEEEEEEEDDDDDEKMEELCEDVLPSSESDAEDIEELKNDIPVFVFTGDSEASSQFLSSTSKTRVAHNSETINDHKVLRLKTQKQAKSMKSLRAVLAERYQKISEPKKEEEKVPVICAKLNTSAVRIAPVPNVKRLLEEKKRVEQMIQANLTRAQTSKSNVRVAHQHVKTQKMKKHTITEGSSVASVYMRQQCFDKILAEVLKINLTNDESLSEAIKLENDLFKSCSQKKSYQMGIAKIIMQLRRKSDVIYGKSKQNMSKRQAVPYNSNSSVVNYKKIEMSELSLEDIYERLIIYKLSPEDLVRNGFPVETSTKGVAKCTLNVDLHYYKKYNYIRRQDVNKRYCIRCSKIYEVDPITLRQLRTGEDVCKYHSGRKINSNLGRVYSCCNTTSEPCSSHTCHVTDNNNYEHYENCAKTKGSKRNVYALDCEMVYTRLGTELARVTVVGLDKKVVYDTLVKPKHAVECYNTQFSGINEEMLSGVKTTLRDVQSHLLKIFGSDTILIGHSLDSDFRALHLVHETVVDTSLAFPSSRTTNKRALRELCATYLNKLIQNDVNGHDSTEDAVASLELMLYKVKEDLSKFYT